MAREEDEGDKRPVGSVGQARRQPYYTQHGEEVGSRTRLRRESQQKKKNDRRCSPPVQLNRRSLASHQQNDKNKIINKMKLAARETADEEEKVILTRSRRTTTSGRTCSPSSHNTTTTTTSDKETETTTTRESKPSSRRFRMRSLRRLLSSTTFRDLSLGYYLSIVMVISFKIFIFANTLNTVMGAKTFYMHWNTSNSIFRIDNTDHIIDVNKGNLAFEYDQVHIICPVYEPGTFDNETEKLIIYNVSKAEYETCRITNANPRIIAVCDKPQKLMYFTITFRPFTPSPGGLEFLPGHDYYFISTSSKDDLHRRIGGRCSTNNMKVVFKVCCGAGGGGSGSSGGDTLTIGESNRTSNGGGRGNTRKALANTTPLPSVKIWSVPSSPAVVSSHRPTINQPVVLQNDLAMTPVQNHSYSGGGGGGGGNWQSSTAATKKTLKPSDFDKRANEVVKYDQELNVNEKSTSNEMVAGDAVSWQRQQMRQQQYVGVLAAAAAAFVVGVLRLQWLY